MKTLHTCVGEDGNFAVGIHKPSFHVKNMRDSDHIATLGQLPDGTAIFNHANFPEGDLFEPRADTIYEIRNPFPFRGSTYINSAWADPRAGHPQRIGLKEAPSCSFIRNMPDKKGPEMLDLLPRPLLLALAQASTDPEELRLLAEKSCRFIHEKDHPVPSGIGYVKTADGRIRPDIQDDELFEVVVNNRFLPDDYKEVMVLRPGVQGTNEITGEYRSPDGTTHVFEYLRRNSYIPWGHFASNMANDAIRYRTCELSAQDMTGIRHLFYQRVFTRLSRQFGLAMPQASRCLSTEELESLRIAVLAAIKQSDKGSLEFNTSLWGWNFGFGFSQSGQRLHASHQMIHQQNALIPATVDTQKGTRIDTFSAGDLITEFIGRYKKSTGKDFFSNYLSAIYHNSRTDGRTNLPKSLIVYEDDNIILFAPKAQVSEWELQTMPKTACGNILEADTAMRQSLDKGILMALQTLERLGATMVTSIEFSKRFPIPRNGQHLLYSFIPRLPYAPGTFSEAQLRFISGCYPEDFAEACRQAMPVS